MPSEEEIRQIEETLSDDKRIETTYRRLRKEGFSRQETVQALLEVLDLSLAEAKELLLTNETWSEVRSSIASQEPPSKEPDDDSPIPPAPA